MVDHSTLVKPPPIDPSKSAIENVLELTELSAIGPVSICLFYLFPALANKLIRTCSPTHDPSGIPQEHEESTAAL